MNYNLHLNITQDIGHGMTLIFICCVMVVLAVLLDLNTGIIAARKAKEKIRSRILRRTVTKITDYYRVLLFGVMIDVLGLAFPWYDTPYCALLITVGVMLIEAKSVLENYRKSKSAAKELPNMLAQIIAAATKDDAEKIIELIKKNEYEETKRISACGKGFGEYVPN